MHVPILQQGDVLIALIQSDLSDPQVLTVRDQLTELVGCSTTRGVVIDVTGMDVIDSFAARSLRSIAEAARLRGARTVVVGIRPDVAIAMVHFDLDLAPLDTAIDVDEALNILATRRARRPSYVP
jgi:rsbT antagonist protein RsbS